MNAVEVKKLSKIYGSGTHALKEIDLEIPEGSFFGLLGPNGAGKSTLIHCLTGLAMPTGGSAAIFGHDAVDEYQKARHNIGLAPQEINLDWFLSVEDTLDFHGGYFGMRKAERQKRTNELLRDFSLLDKRKARSNFLSGGMKRRVVLARALMHRPRMVILDEPTAGVDVELRLELWRYIKKINQQGTTILLTTHYIEEAERLCDKIALINKGEIIETGTAEQLKKRFKQKTLEDVYLKVVGRSELTRSLGIT
ncbi:ABC transporter ATP-binding protein [Candidatus Parcubacteria bacterium]|nr:ABC transporter ATP-binding protein [Candidatus Parcubacteria bacterium]